MKYKICACCHRLLDETHFTKNARNKDGLHSYCRECNRLKAKRFNKEKGNEYTKKYRVKQINSGYYRFGHGAYANMKRSAKKRGIEFLLTEEDLKQWWISTKDVCYYCGIDIEEYKRIRDFIIAYEGGNTTIAYIKTHVYNKPIYEKIDTMTIDRVNSFGPYSINNIVKSCWICNSLKGNVVSEEQMMIKSKEVLENIRKEMSRYEK